MTLIIVTYEHDPADLHRIDLAVAESGVPGDEDWRPAMRDTIDGRRVVWARFDVPRRYTTWVRDRDGVRAVRRSDVTAR